MKKVGIVTFHKAHNYGAMLQAFALSKTIKEQKNEVELINYYEPKIYDQYKIIRPFSKNPLKSLLRFKEDLFNYKKKKMRYESFEQFIINNCNISKLYNCENDLKNDTLDYEILITGSDQVWNPNIVGKLSDIYTLNFGKDSIKRISYAASIGRSIIEEKYIEDYKNKLSVIDNISVREDDAKKTLESIINKDIHVVLDPTLLLEKEEWDSEISELNKEKEKYICAYVVKPDEDYIKIVNDLSERTGLKVIHFGLKNPGYNNVLKSAYTEGPLEFVNYIKNAEYVVATSFHATAFSVIYNKKFFIVPHRQTGSRVTNLLEKLDIKGRTFLSYEDFKNIDYDFESNWELVNQKLQEESTKSKEWLKNTLNA